MAFSEKVKAEIRKMSHFRCCLCHSLGVEVHHIIPASERGPDSQDNAAPLCPSCHEIYGANPQKRKFILEARDFWFEICEKRLAPNLELLNEISNTVKNTASKDDLQHLIDKLSPLFISEENGESISIELPEKYWVLVLFALDEIVKTTQNHIKKLRDAGINPNDIAKMEPGEITALIGPLITRSIIVDKMVEKGVMKAEAGQKLGKSLIDRMIDRLPEDFRKTLSE